MALTDKQLKELPRRIRAESKHVDPPTAQVFRLLVLADEVQSVVDEVLANRSEPTP